FAQGDTLGVAFDLDNGLISFSVNGSLLRANLPLSIQESLQTGVGPNGEPLTKEEKLMRIRDVITAFARTGATEKYRTTVGLIQGMPDASSFAGQMIDDPLPEQRIESAAERDTLLREGKSGATVYAMLIRQMKVDGEVFHEAYKKFLGDMEQLVNIRLGLIVEVDTIAESWKALASSLSVAAGTAAILPLVSAAGGGSLALNLGYKTLRSMPGIIRNPGSVVAGLRSAPRFAGRAGGSALLAYRAYKDFEELGEISRSMEMQKAKVIAELRQCGFEGDGEEFSYKDGSTEIKVNINHLDEAKSEQENAQAVRALASAGMALAVLRFGVSRTFLPLAALEVSVEVIRYGMDQESDRRFLLKAPAWLLAKINLEEATGDTAYSMLVKSSGEMMTDSPFNDGRDSVENTEKKEIREKMLFAIFNTEMRSLT
ncbi:MAG: hypothetical protein ABL994_21085, partial [Verrucomicrobiales bacterium]